MGKDRQTVYHQHRHEIDSYRKDRQTVFYEDRHSD